MSLCKKFEQRFQEFQNQIDSILFELLMLESVVISDLDTQKKKELCEKLEGLFSKVTYVEHDFKDFKSTISEMR